MNKVKQIKIKSIPANIANPFVVRHHYSRKVVQNSSLHLGVFLNGVLHGVMSFGSPMDKRKVLGLVVHKKTKKKAPWNDMLELNRMAFDDALPKNSESRAISVAIKLLRKYAPNIKWILSFADGTQAGNGTIYRASGFKLTQIKPNKTLLRMPSGDIVANMTLTAHFHSPIVKKQSEFLNIEHKYRTEKEWVELGAEPLKGSMYRYIKIIDPDYILNCEELSYKDIVR